MPRWRLYVVLTHLDLCVVHILADNMFFILLAYQEHIVRLCDKVSLQFIFCIILIVKALMVKCVPIV